MLRLPLLPELPMSRLAIWSWRFALFGLAVAVLSIIIVRTGLLEVAPALVTFGAALLFAAFAVLLAFFAFVVIWQQGLAGLGRAVGGLMLGIFILVYPAYLSYRGLKQPAINDITTDTQRPPSFGKLAALRRPGTDAYAAQFAALQAKAYPGIGPLQFDVPPRIAYRETLKLIEGRKWQVVDEMPPAGGRDGMIEAVTRTLIMGFPDDVVIRVSAGAGNSSRVDVRSASRYGVNDFGTNARRVMALLAEIDEAVSSAPPEQAAPPETTAPPDKRPARRRPPRR